MSREMPNAVSLEQSVLGSLMVYPKSHSRLSGTRSTCRRILFAFSSADLSGYLYNS